jgi:phosphatidylinositol alpha 1,6-mannosyltransferase
VGLPTPTVSTALRTHDFDVAFLVSPFMMGRRAGEDAQRHGIPIVALYYTDPMMIAGQGLSALTERKIWAQLGAVHNLADVNLAPTPAAANDLHAQGIPRVQLWEPGVDTSRFSPGLRNERLRRALAPGGELIVGYVGRLAAEKQVDLLAETSRLPGVRVVVVGHGPDTARLRSLLPDAVFTGSRRGSALARLYASFDVFVHPGGWETAGLTILEAQASGCAAIVPDSRGAADMIEPGRTGLLVRPDSGPAIAAAVARLSTEPGLVAGLGTAAATAAAERSWHAAGDRLIRHFDAVRVRKAQLT